MSVRSEKCDTGFGWQPSAPATGALDFYTLTPCRLLDTRNAAGPYGAPALFATVATVPLMFGLGRELRRVDRRTMLGTLHMRWR